MRALSPGAALLLGAFAAALGALAAWPRFPKGAAPLPPLHVVCVDLSASVRRPRPDLLPWLSEQWVAEAHAARAAGREIALVHFGRSARTLFGPAAPEELLERLSGSDGRTLDPRLSREEELGSDLAEALGWVRTLLGEGVRAPGHLTLVSDGWADGADPRPLLAGLPVASSRWLELPPPERVDGAILDLWAADPQPAGAPLRVGLELGLQGAGSGPHRVEVHVELHRAGELHAKVRIPVEFAPETGGARSERVRRRWLGADLGPAPAGTLAVRARVALAPEHGPDAATENNFRQVELTTAGLVPTAVVLGEGASAGPWADPEGLARLGLGARILTAAELVQALPGVRLVVTLDVPPGQLPDRELGEWIDGGGGWLGSFPRELPGLDRLAVLGPRAALHPGRSDRPAREVAFLVDVSGSMSGEPIEELESAALDLLAAVPEGDRVVVHFFTARLFPPVDLSAAASRQDAARALFRARPPSGPTELLRAVEEFAAYCERSARPVLAFLLSDGREEGDPPRAEARAGEVVRRLEALGVTLHALAVGRDRSLADLERVAPGRVRELGADLGADLRAALRSEVHAELREPGPLVLRWVRESALAGGAAGPDPAPGPLVEVQSAKLVPPAEPLLLGPGGEVALGLVRRGLGRVATAAGDFGGTGHPPPEELGALLAFLGAGPPSALSVRVCGRLPGAPRILVEGDFEALSEVQGASFTGGPVGRERALNLEWAVSPGGDGYLWAPLPGLPTRPGEGFAVALVGGQPGSPQQLQRTLLLAPPPKELDPGAAVHRVGPGDLPEPRRPAPRALGAHPLAPILGALALGLGVLGLVLFGLRLRLARGRDRIQGPGVGAIKGAPGSHR